MTTKFHYIIRAKNGETPSNTDVFASTFSEKEAIELLNDAKMQFDYADVLINGKRYRSIN